MPSRKGAGITRARKNKPEATGPFRDTGSTEAEQEDRQVQSLERPEEHQVPLPSRQRTRPGRPPGVNPIAYAPYTPTGWRVSSFWVGRGLALCPEGRGSGFSPQQPPERADGLQGCPRRRRWKTLPRCRRGVLDLRSLRSGFL